MARRIAVGVEYDGTVYAGWQAQSGLPTLQLTLQAAISRVADETIDLIGAGRTDAGVHARGQVGHFDTRAVRSIRAWLLGINTYLPPDISVSWVCPVPRHFHARYSAEARVYRYFILNRLARSALDARRSVWVHRRLDHDAMMRAAAPLLGEHDFTAFRSSECQSRSPVRRIEFIRVTREGDWVVIEVCANAFLHHMMRNIAGALLAVGLGKRPSDWVTDVLAGRDRTRGAATAPAAGLHLWKVRYPQAFRLPADDPLSSGLRPQGLLPA